ncbi:MAG TPA: hypothetical protein VKU41_31990, partial [Polyangiaceae bacterium]|nr:hypothetical protein [Polyangiaceae bacterium]
AEALRIGGESTLDNIPIVARATAASNSGAARGKVIAVTGRASAVRPEGSYLVGTLTTDSGPVYWVTPFATRPPPATVVRFRGVFVQRFASATQSSDGQPPSLVLVGAFSQDP